MESGRRDGRMEEGRMYKWRKEGIKNGMEKSGKNEGRSEK